MIKDSVRTCPQLQNGPPLKLAAGQRDLKLEITLLWDSENLNSGTYVSLLGKTLTFDFPISE